VLLQDTAQHARTQKKGGEEKYLNVGDAKWRREVESLLVENLKGATREETFSNTLAVVVSENYIL
jgi:hypothetical protein